MFVFDIWKPNWNKRQHISLQSLYNIGLSVHWLIIWRLVERTKLIEDWAIRYTLKYSEALCMECVSGCVYVYIMSWVVRFGYYVNWVSCSVYTTSDLIDNQFEAFVVGCDILYLKCLTESIFALFYSCNLFWRIFYSYIIYDNNVKIKRCTVSGVISVIYVLTQAQ